MFGLDSKALKFKGVFAELGKLKRSRMVTVDISEVQWMYYKKCL